MTFPTPPTPPGAEADPEFFKVLTEIDMISHMAKNEFERLLPAGMTQAQFGVLNRLTRLEIKETVSQLAFAFQVTQPTMTSTLKKLKSKSYIFFEADSTDKRVKRVHITKSGRATRDKIVFDMAPLISAQIDAIGSLDFEILLRDLGKIRTQLEERMKTKPT